MSGHVLNRKTVINWKKKKSGSPPEWYTEMKQGERKLMVFTVMHGSGNLFGPYFLPNGATFNGETYRNMLTDQVFPKMMQVLGHAGFFNTIWQQVWY